eukprot:1637591-Amphidinium_carterae.3
MSKVIYCSDASKQGYSMLQTQAHFAEVAELTKRKEAWRFVEKWVPNEQSSHDVERVPSCGVFELVPGLCDSLVGGSITQQTRKSARAHKNKRIAKATEPHKCIDEVPIPAVPNSVSQPDRWRIVCAGARRQDEPIHMLEARAALAGLKHAAIKGRLAHGSCLVASPGVGDMLSLFATQRMKVQDGPTRANSGQDSGMLPEAGCQPSYTSEVVGLPGCCRSPS